MALEKFDVFLSYNWDVKDSVRKLYEVLTVNHEYKCWMDDFAMGSGSLNEELRKGVQASEIILCCITQKYVNSTNCKREITYADLLQKKIVILMFEDLEIEKLGEIGFIISLKPRFNLYETKEVLDKWSGEPFNKILKSITNYPQVSGPEASWHGKTAKVTPLNLTETTNKTAAKSNKIMEQLTKPYCGILLGIIGVLILGAIIAIIVVFTLPKVRNIKTLTGHSGYVYALLVIDDKSFASGSADKTIKIWNIESGEATRTLSGHTGSVQCLTFTKNGYLASGSKDATIKIWNTNNGELLSTLSGHASGVFALALNNAGNLASGSWDNSVKVWNTDTSTVSVTATNHSGDVVSLIGLNNGKLVSGSFDNTIKVWNAPFSGTIAYKLYDHTGPVLCLMTLIIPNKGSVYVASGSSDKLIKIWDSMNGFSIERTLKGHDDSVKSLARLNNGHMASGSADLSIRIWKLETGVEVVKLSGHTGEVNSLALLNNGNLVSASNDKTIKIWETNTY